MDLTIIRHGQSHVNLDTWFELESLDAGLTEKGVQQAEALRDWLIANNASADVLYTSTMARTLETAKYVSEALHLEPIHDHRIREIPAVYTSGEAVPPEELPRTYASDWANKAPFIPRSKEKDGYESWMHFRTRVGQFTDAMIEKHYGQKVFVVSHGGVISALFDNAFNIGAYRRADVMNYNTSWSRFEYRTGNREVWLLWDHNRVDHLVGKDLL